MTKYTRSNMKKYSRVKVAKSTIPNAGKGIFAARNYDKDEFVTYYSGKVTHYKPYDCTYVVKLRDRSRGKLALYVDGEYPLKKTHVGHIINHYPAGKNVELTWDSSKKRNPQRWIEFRTTRKVKKGEEFFWDYGEDYWRTSIPNTPL